MPVRKEPSGRYAIFLYDPRAGRKVRVSGTFEKRRDALNAEAKARLEMARLKDRLSWTIGDYAEWWLKHAHGPNTPRPEHTTWLHNRQQLRALTAAYGSSKLIDFSRGDARDFARAHRSNVKAASAMFGDAVRDERCNFNPFEKLRLGQPRGRKDIQPATEAEVEMLAEIARRAHGQAYGPMCAGWVTFAAWVGLWPGEMFALRWNDLDFQAGLVRIERQIRVDGEHAPKTKKARTVVLPDQARDAVLAMGTIRNGLVFRNVSGGQISKGGYAWYWNPVAKTFLEKVGPARSEQLRGSRPSFDLYSLRHFCASVLIDRGVSEWDVAHQLGNSPEVVRDVYGHLYPDRSTDRLRAAFARNVVPLRREAL